MLTKTEVIRKPIETIGDARAWIEGMVKLRWTPHLDDPIETEMLPGLPDRDVGRLDRRRREVHDFDGQWGLFDCPHGYMLACMWSEGLMEYEKDQQPISG